MNTRSLRRGTAWPACVLTFICSAGQAQESSGEASLPTITVSAQQVAEQLETERALTPGHVTIIDGTELYRRNVANLADLLRYVPGVWSESSSGSDAVFISSRGSNLDATHYDMNGVKLLQDGLPVTTADGNNHNRVLDPLSARYATIAHGANGLTYGASTLGGAIDFISPTARTSDRLALFVAGGSHGQLNGRISAGFAGERLDALATVEAKNWDGYRDHGRQERTGLYANAGWRWSDAVSTRVFITALNSDEQLTGALSRAEVRADAYQAAPTALGGNSQVNVDTRRIAAKTTWAINALSSLEFGLSYEEQSLYHPIVDRIMVDIDGPGPNPPVEVFSLLVDTDQDNAGANLRYRLQRANHQLLLGINYGDTTNQGGNYRNLNGQRNGLRETVDNWADSLEFFAMDRWSITPKLTLVYGAQFVNAGREVRLIDATTRHERNPKDNYSSFNPRFGVIYALGASHEFFASASRLYEAPTNYELEDDAEGNDNTLNAMKGNVLEFGFRGTSGDDAGVTWRWDVAAYYARINDEILSRNNEDVSDLSEAINIENTIHAGIEALVGASFATGKRGRIEPLLSFTLNRFSFDDDLAYGNNNLPAAPRYVARGEILYRQGGMYAGPTFDLVGKRYADFANTYEVDSHGLIGLRGGYSAETWELFLELRNLTDKQHITNVGALNRAGPDDRLLSPGAPRSAYAGAKWVF